MVNCLKDWQQRVPLNGQTSAWKNISTVVPQGSVFGPLSFVIYINDLPDRLTLHCKLFADGTSLFLNTINRQKYEIEPDILFNPEVYFHVPHEPLIFSNNKIESAYFQKYLGLILDSKLDFNQHIDDKINRKSLPTIYKFFVRPLLDYADIIYDKPCNESCKEQLEAVAC